MHAFGQRETAHGPLTPVFKQAVPGYSIDRYCEIFSPPRPDHVKLDVDGIEERILRGGRATLASSVKSVLVEVDGDEKEDRALRIREFLNELNFQEDAISSESSGRNLIFRRGKV